MTISQNTRRQPQGRPSYTSLAGATNFQQVTNCPRFAAPVLPLFASCYLLRFHTNTNCPICNSFVLITMQQCPGVGGASPSFSSSLTLSGHPNRDAGSHRAFTPGAAEGQRVEGSLFNSSWSPVSILPSLRKPFRVNTCKTPRKCSFQRTYGKANLFRINTYTSVSKQSTLTRLESALTQNRGRGYCSSIAYDD